MERFYVKTEVRMGIIEEVYEDESFYYMSFYYNEGYCIYEDGWFVGILTVDSIEGWYDGRKFKFILNNNAYEYAGTPFVLKEDIQIPILKKTQEIASEEKIDCLTIPCKITTISSNDPNLCVIIDFLNLENDPVKQKQIENDLQKAGLI